MPYRIECKDVLAWARDYDGPPFHAALADPPYHLISDVRNGSPRVAGAGPYGRHTVSTKSKGFMGQDWDGGDVAFRPETWAALGQHLLPGAFGMAFASSRGWHRMACAIEDAGFVLHPSVFVWLFGSGFPKATRIDTAVDKAAGAEREVMGQGPYAARRPRASHASQGLVYADDAYLRPAGDTITAPATPLAQAWAGHRYGLQALKPAVEPIIVFQKPYEGKPVECITRTGAGALNVDGGRIGTQYIEAHGGGINANGRTYGQGKGIPALEPGTNGHSGRWPANFALVHHPDCNGECVDGCPVRALGEQSGELQSGYSPPNALRNASQGKGGYHGNFPDQYTAQGTYGDTGTAARFFHNADWAYEVAERLALTDPVRYVPKASRGERDAGLDAWTPQTTDDGRPKPIDNPYLRGETLRHNPHPTVKPISLTRWLATLLLPPAFYAPRRLLVPFAGVGSEMVGGLLAGWEEIEGVEREAEYNEIGLQRLHFWACNPTARFDEESQNEAEEVEDAPDEARQLRML